MTRTIKPATPLPWYDDGRYVVQHAPDNPRPIRIAECHDAQHAAYIVAACNAYPELVAALRDALPALNGWAGAVRRSRGHHSQESAIADKRLHAARALLAKLGEAA